jgi:hypothetical protein
MGQRARFAQTLKGFKNSWWKDLCIKQVVKL